MGLSFWHLLILLLVVLLLFGPGRLPKLMGDIGKGVRSMREGLKGDDEKKE
jgi:sec-independent protein translocase protein TatA